MFLSPIEEPFVAQPFAGAECFLSMKVEVEIKPLINERTNVVPELVSFNFERIATVFSSYGHNNAACLANIFDEMSLVVTRSV